MLAVIAAVALAWVLGILFVSALWPRARRFSEDWSLIFPLGMGVGFGVTSGFFFFASLVFERPLFHSGILDLLWVLGLSWHIRRRLPLDQNGVRRSPKWSWFTVFAASILLQASIVAIVVAARAYAAEPYGGWDAWAIWNMHARFLFRAKEYWPTLLHHGQIAWTHLDYPLLLSASVARAWAYAGRESTFAAGLISTMFGGAAVWLLIATVRRLRNELVALVGGLILLGSPGFVTFSSNEHADIPVGFFILSTASVIALSKGFKEERGMAVLAGICAGDAAWTKNEGVLFVVVAGLLWLLCAVRDKSPRAAGWFLVGLALALFPEAYFKIVLAPSNDIASEGIFHRLAYLTDGSRHALILKSFARDLGRFGNWQMTPFLAMLLPLFVPGRPRLTSYEWAVVGIITLMLAGYYTVYLLTPWDLAWHLDTSLVRLLLQLWPVFLLCWCLALSQEGVSPPRFAVKHEPSRKGWIVFGTINLAALGGIWVFFSTQLSINELAVSRFGGATARVVLGDGWYGAEKYHRDRWAWSQEKSVLLVYLESNTPAPLTLNFSMRSLGSGKITATIGNKVIWRASSHEKLASVDALSAVFSPGTTEIVFESDSSGVRERPVADARSLAFSIYNLRLDPRGE